MILDKLHKNQVAGMGTVIWPLYMVFKERLILKKFDDVKIIHWGRELKQNVWSDVKKNGLLCPMVIDENNQLRDGNHRFRMLTKKGDASFFYKAASDDEVNFFSMLNILCCELHPDMTQLMEKLWEGKIKKYTEKVSHLFTENVRIAKI
tara:strand:- start:1042 stop:1488 length:447 start_codon:yes stop_codon:yes gene_type:complete